MPQNQNIYRRHLGTCQHRTKGRAYNRCNCPIWLDRKTDGKRIHRALKTCDWTTAQQRAAGLASDAEQQPPSLQESLERWQKSLMVSPGTRRKYASIARELTSWASVNHSGKLSDLTVSRLSAFRESRNLARATSANELQILRQFFGFCCARGWIKENPAKAIRAPHAQSSQVMPFSEAEMVQILAACNHIGHGEIELRLARALVLVMRYTGLAIGDAVMLRKDALQPDGFLVAHRHKTGQTVRLRVPEAVLDALGPVTPHAINLKTAKRSHYGRVKLQTDKVRAGNDLLLDAPRETGFDLFDESAIQRQDGEMGIRVCQKNREAGKRAVLRGPAEPCQDRQETFGSDAAPHPRPRGRDDVPVERGDTRGLWASWNKKGTNQGSSPPTIDHGPNCENSLSPGRPEEEGQRKTIWHQSQNIVNGHSLNNAGEYFFWDGISSKRALLGWAERVMAKIKKLSGVADFHSHRFRHTLAVSILASGGTIEDVARILGNTPAVAYKHYSPWCRQIEQRIDGLMEKVRAKELRPEEIKPQLVM